MWRLCVPCLALVAACAQGGRQNIGDDGDDGSNTPIDARPPIDTITIDAPPMMVTLSQTTSPTVGGTNSFACGNANTGTTGDNQWYRVFRLADFNITGGLVVNSVAFGVQDSNGMPTVTVKVGTYSGVINPAPDVLDTTLITPIGMATYAVQNITSAAPQLITVPLMANVPALSQLVAEVDVPDLQAAGKRFYIGGNAAGQTAPTWLRSIVCSPDGKAKNINSAGGLNAPSSQIILQVNGTYSP
ncbi:MAG TPA: hypothetical protein VGM90_00800 [Kofleriaceae bacterium]|jgi:hypothetical protein